MIFQYTIFPTILLKVEVKLYIGILWTPFSLEKLNFRHVSSLAICFFKVTTFLVTFNISISWIFIIEFSPGEPVAKRRKKREVVTVSKADCAKMLKEKKFSVVEYDGRAQFWTTYRMVQTEDKIDTNYVECRRCGTQKGTKTISAHHLKCNALASCRSMENYVTKEKQITKEEKTALSHAAAEFCFKDLRPFYAIEGPGLLQLLASVSSLSAKYGVLDENQLKKFLPCANTVSGQFIYTIANAANVSNCGYVSI